MLVPRFERLLDVAWMLRCADTAIPVNSVPRPDGVTDRLRVELAHLVADCGAHGGADLAFALREALGDPAALPRVLRDAASRLGPAPDPLARWIERIMTDRGLGQQLDEPVEIDTAPEAPLLEWIQTDLAHRLARLTTTIEVNPSSNLLVGGLEAPLQQPMFLLRPLQPSDGDPGLDVTISADDPLQFATHLADEYAYAWAGMVVAGDVPPTVARRWLDDAASASWRSRFTTPLDD